ncbi:lens fiber membrane intrinsic protein-like [Clavelina lepadiformis]|uniref:lens fiber membrane intrinsic protein-like n=1 Tax=Clavelina lepadiformis TaxID=159417 RepID=UPI0040419136
MRSPAATLVNLIVIIHAFLSCGLTVFSVIAPYWYDLWPELGNGGLFVYCFEDECKTLSGSVYHFIHVTRGFMIMAAAGNFLGFFVLAAATKCRRRRRIIQRVGSSFVLLGGIFAFVSLATFTVRCTDLPFLPAGLFSYSYSYVLGWVAGAVSTITGAVSFAFPLPKKCHKTENMVQPRSAPSTDETGLDRNESV